MRAAAHPVPTMWPTKAAPRWGKDSVKILSRVRISERPGWKDAYSDRREGKEPELKGQHDDVLRSLVVEPEYIYA